VNTLLRSLIVWLLLLALPYQGVAAAAMAACGPAQAMPAAVAAPHRMQAAQHPPCHEGAAIAPSGDKQKQQEQQAHAGSAKCAHCAACAIGIAVLPAGFPPLAVHAPPAASHPAADGHLPSVHLAQPERPPRPRLA
jgi:hypothetical protein